MTMMLAELIINSANIIVIILCIKKDATALMVSYLNLNKTFMQVFLHRLLRFVTNVNVLYYLAIALLANGTTTLPFNFTLQCLGEHRDGAVVRALTSHQCGPGSIPGVDAILGLSLLLVLVPASRFFSLHKNQHFQIPIQPGNSGGIATMCMWPQKFPFIF